MGVLVYNFTQRLDPLVWFYVRLKALILWQSPLVTAGVGLLLTVLLLNLKTALLLGALVLVCGQDLLFRKVSQVQKYQTLPNRLIVP
jgi:hypothetical protein